MATASGIGFALFGAGRIGRVHAASLAACSGAHLVCVYDVVPAAAAELANQYRVAAAPDVATALATPGVDATLIAASTNTHLDLMAASTAAGKPTLCEKPIDLDLARVDRRRAEIVDTGVPVQIGFQRRYDGGHGGLRKAVREGAIGKLEQIIISSRDPGPPPLDYLRTSGGLYRDMMIHDFDLARWLLGEEPAELAAYGSVLIDPNAAETDDIDSAMVVMRTASGVLCHINCSRRAVYGHDQRVEAVGAEGMLISGNRHPTGLERYTAATTAGRDPIVHFFLERYAEAYRSELDDFVDCIVTGRQPAVTFDDGRAALLLADAADRSRRSGQSVRISADRSHRNGQSVHTRADRWP